MYRHDNFPDTNWKEVSTYPKHFHNGSQDAVNESHIEDDPFTALRQFMDFARTHLASITHRCILLAQAPPQSDRMTVFGLPPPDGPACVHARACGRSGAWEHATGNALAGVGRHRGRLVQRDAGPGVLIEDLVEILFSYAQLFEDFVKKPASYLRIAMYRNRGCPAIWMLPSGVASLLPNHPKAKFFQPYVDP